MRFDWRWIVIIVVVALIANLQALPWPLVSAALLGSGGYLVWYALRNAGMRVGSQRSREVYWRGRRVDLEAERPAAHNWMRLPSWQALRPVAVYLLIGSVIFLVGVSHLMRNIGL